MIKTTTAAAILIALAAATSADARRMSCPAVTTADVEAQFKRFNDAWATGNPDTVTALFAPDAMLLATVSNQERDTPQEIRDYFVSFLKGQPVGTINTSFVTIDCDVAVRAGEWTVNAANAQGVRGDILARYTFVYKWDGKDWKIKHLHSSVRPPKN